jgi:hypothetical protein
MVNQDEDLHTLTSYSMLLVCYSIYTLSLYSSIYIIRFLILHVLCFVWFVILSILLLCIPILLCSYSVSIYILMYVLYIYKVYNRLRSYLKLLYCVFIVKLIVKYCLYSVSVVYCSIFQLHLISMLCLWDTA